MKQMLIHNKEEKGVTDKIFWPQFLEDETEKAEGTDQERFDKYLNTIEGDEDNEE